MTPYHATPDYTLYRGDCLSVLEQLPERSAQMCVTSPPYFALRSYLPKDHADKALEIGSEPTPEQFIETMVSVFGAVRRVLRDDGTLWLNLGDTYSSESKHGGRTSGKHVSALHGRDSLPIRTKRYNLVANGNILNIPHQVAAALAADGWYWRQTIVWQKPAPMPESCQGWRWARCRVKISRKAEPTQPSKADRGAGDVFGSAKNRDCIGGEWQGGTVWRECPGCDRCSPNGGYVLRRGRGRCTTAHEYLFVFSKSSRYFWDSESSKEACAYRDSGNLERKANHQPEGRNNQSGNVPYQGSSRNPRSVWKIPAEMFKGKHFAAYPTELVRRCIVAGTSAGGCCAECGACWAPVVEQERVATRPGTNTKVQRVPNGWDTGPGAHDTIEWNQAEKRGLEVGNRDPGRHIQISRVLGYRPTCTCGAASVPCAVLDPFAGTAQTCRAAKWLGRKSIGIDLNEAYLDMAIRRIARAPKWARKVNGEAHAVIDDEPMPLFSE